MSNNSSIFDIPMSRKAKHDSALKRLPGPAAKLNTTEVFMLSLPGFMEAVLTGGSLHNTAKMLVPPLKIVEVLRTASCVLAKCNMSATLQSTPERMEVNVVECIKVVRLPLDLLTQHLVGQCIGKCAPRQHDEARHVV